ncbi:MAG: 1-(5-phosphoribosyl)-5-[(5-phosphoribosylamino)methylideneamino]imidazole-4-carboxamide isomerase [Candidatus Margulisiibacteriota bacterium]|nr:1-(5-phosphoribosyl)-5-[(5-phosphoribosylamino)methylideneamino]imidazole-4-carboxamide isomerase [Candidatus Margulisiibacteriota bacterium]
MSFRLIPAIDIIDGALVRLYKGDYAQQTSYTTTPLEMALNYQNMGLDYIHIVDLNGAKDGKLTNLDTIQEIVQKTGLTVQVGGGVRHAAHVETLLNAGVSAVIIGSLFVKDLDLALDIVQQFPNQVIAGLDIHGDCIASHGWTETSSITLDDMLKTLDSVKLHSIVTTDIQKDGTFEGPNISLYKQMASKTSHTIVASGGVASINDVLELKELNLLNITGCIVGKAIIEGKISREDLVSIL